MNDDKIIDQTDDVVLVAFAGAYYRIGTIPRALHPTVLLSKGKGLVPARWPRPLARSSFVEPEYFHRMITEEPWNQWSDVRADPISWLSAYLTSQIL